MEAEGVGELERGGAQDGVSVELRLLPPCSTICRDEDAIAYSMVGIHLRDRDLLLTEAVFRAARLLAQGLYPDTVMLAGRGDDTYERESEGDCTRRTHQIDTVDKERSIFLLHRQWIQIEWRRRNRVKAGEEEPEIGGTEAP
ncbi:hypothetical protein E2562_030686 [Oryza meyeriana var. granulata]|uniref:Uncharacterized protein n=1 Tax=Oryza meyeriana var. granulata TaxID=110450 RepID=A0A6G1DQF3_9ORYZ|nr:hypothetical protein E2562_030686 [Oryza meyeriana var. granulata]